MTTWAGERVGGGWSWSMRWVPALAVLLSSCFRDPHPPTGVETASLVTANNTITQAGDETRTGWFPDQPLLDPATVGSGNFGRLWKTQLELGQSQLILAQPLVIGGQVLVVTEGNNLYLVDALTGAVTNSRSLGVGFNAAQTLGCGDTIPTIGITGTPVADVTTSTAYFYSKDSAGDYALHAVSTTDLSERNGFPVTISGFAENDGSAAFDSFYELQRTGLLLMNGVVYAGFGSQCDDGPFRGWIIGVTTSGVIHNMFTTAPNTPTGMKGNGVWMSGSGLMSDGPGQIVFSTSNGYNGDPYNQPISGNLPPADLENAVVRLVVQPGGGLEATDFFAAYDASSLSAANQEVGAGGVVALPAQFGTLAIPHLAVAGGKDAVLYLLNRDSLGGFQQGPNGSDGSLASIPLGGSTFSRPGVWPGEGGYIYVMVNGGTSTTGFNLEAFKYGTDGNGKPSLALAGAGPDNFGAYSGSPIVTSNGTNPGSALVWATNLTAELRVYDAVPVNGVLNIRFRDGYGAEAKFTTPGVGAGAVYVGTSDGYLVGYGVTARSVSGNPVAFGTVGVGQPTTLTATITASQAVTVNAVSSSSGTFVLGAPSVPLPAALLAGQSFTVPVTFTPADTISYVASLAIATSSTPGAISLTGTGQANGPHLAVSPSPLDFGGIAVGTSRSLPLSLTNNGTGTLTFADITAPAAPFSVSGAPANGTTLAPGTSTTMTVTFAPNQIADFTSSLAIASDGGTPTVPLTGLAGAPATLVVTPLDNDFGTVVVGTSKTMSFTLENTGGVDLTITISKAPVQGQFAAQTILQEGSTILAGQTLTETVQLTPTATGTLSDTWNIGANDSNGVQHVSFTASSVAPLPRNGWVATASATAGGDVAALAIDAAGTNTRWSSGVAQSDAAETFTIDMLSPQTFSMISIDSDGDHARVWELYASDDPANWGNAVATGTTATDDPAVISFPTQTHRYLQIRQDISANTGAWWSIYDLQVYGITAPVSGPYLEVSPNPLGFGAITTGTTKSIPVTLSNQGTGTLTFSGVTSPAAPFSVSGAPANGATLAPGASTTLTVQLAPLADGAYSSSFAVGSDGGSVTVSVTGSSGAAANLVVTPLQNDFGLVLVGASKSMTFALQNTGGSDLTITQSTPPALGPFVAQTSLAQGSTIPAGATVTETVQVTPSAPGAISDVWTISGNDSSGPHTVTFTANGIAALPRDGWVATASATGGGDVPAQAIDGAGVSTRWSSGMPQSQPQTQTFTLDMLSPQTFSMIRMDSNGDYARNWELYASDDGANWGAAITTGTAVADPVIIVCPTQNHRYLQIRQLQSVNTGAWWSIYDLNVYGGGNVVAPKPQLSVSTNALDFGSVAAGASKSLPVSLSNTGTGTLTFSGTTSPTAPFTVSGAPGNGATLAPGASMTVTVTLAPNAPGTWASSFAVGSDGGAATVSLSGLTPAAPKLAASTNALDFGSVAIGASQSLTVALSNTGAGTLTFSGTTSPAAPFTLGGAPGNGATLAPGASMTVTVMLAPMAAGTWASSFAVGSDGGTATVSLTGITPALAPQLAVSTNALDFGSVAAGASQSLDVSLSNTGTGTLTFSGTTSPAAPFTLSGAPGNGTTLAPGASTTVTVQLAPIVAGTWDSSFAVASDGGSATVSLTGLTPAPPPVPQLAVSTNALDFGSVAVGASKSLDVSLSNTGTGTLTFSGTTSPAAPFTVSGAPGNGTTLAPGASTTVTVMLAPMAAGTWTSSFAVASDGGSATVSLTGLTPAPPPPPVSGPLSRTGWVATASLTGGGNVAASAIDASTTTRWDSGRPQSKGVVSFTVDMQAAQTFDQVQMDSEADYARSYQVFVSADGVNWGGAVATGSATTTPVIATFATQTARFVQVRQLNSPGTRASWSLYDFNVIVGGTLPRAGWTASASKTGGTNTPAKAIDSTLTSRWSTGLAQSGAATQRFTLDMKSPQTFSQITMASSGDYARSWEVYVSSDGVNWGAPVAKGTSSASPVAVPFTSTTARYLQIRQLQSLGTTSVWSIYDLHVYGP